MNRAPVLVEQVADIQALVRTGFGRMSTSRFWLLTVGDRALAADWLGSLRQSDLVPSIATIDSRQELAEAVTIAFSYVGLLALGLEEHPDFPFPAPFRSGMGSRARKRLLRDTTRPWRWADAADVGASAGPVHLLVVHWSNAAAGGQSRFVPPPADAFSRIRCVHGPSRFLTESGMVEAFGFRDGVSQPIVAGLTESSKARKARIATPEFHRDRHVLPGEFVAGYRNEYRELSYTPSVKNWSSDAAVAFGFNGSYLAVRQIEQHVDAFRAYDRAVVMDNVCPAGVTWAEKMIGRRRDGAPLGWPHAVPPANDAEADAFRYRVDDADGFVCPLGAHTRRANPRDLLGVDLASAIRSSKLHRLLRRGRPYAEERAGKGVEGMMFMALNADLERQFEFVMQRWLQNPRFGGLERQDDPLLGETVRPRHFTAQGEPLGVDLPIDRFTTTRGGGYFFMPGLRALDFLVSQARRIKTDALIA